MSGEGMQGFVDYLVRNDLVPAKYARFHGMWVRRFLSSARAQPELSLETARVRYLSRLGEQPGIPDWQTRQAAVATRIYLANYLPATGRGAEADSTGSIPESASDAVRRMREELRLGHYAYRTEQIYTSWTRKYFSYLLRTV